MRLRLPHHNAPFAQGRTFTGMSTGGGDPFSIVHVADVGTEPVNITIGGAQCTGLTKTIDNGLAITDSLVTVTLSCLTPPGVGRQLPIIITTLGGSSYVDPAFLFSYAPPSLIADPSLVSARLRRLQVLGGPLVPTLGGTVSFDGYNLGGLALTSDIVASLDATSQLVVVNMTQTLLVVRVPPGDGANHSVAVAVAGQPSNVVTLSYAPPSVASISPQYPAGNAPALGGFPVTILGSNFGLSVPSVTIGGLPCIVSGPAYNHSNITCTAPAGAGRNLPVVVTVSGQASALSDGSTFRYNPPRVLGMWPLGGPTSGRANGTAIPNSLLRNPGPRINVTLYGRSLSTGGNISFRVVASDPSSAVAWVPPQDVQLWNDSMVVFYMPPGYGTGLSVVVTVAGQTQLDQLQPDPPVLFSYDAPTILSVGRPDRDPATCLAQPSCSDGGFNGSQLCLLIPGTCYPTGGGFTLQIVGTSFAGLIASSNGQLTISVGGVACPVAAPPPTDDVIYCTLPQGAGDADALVVTVGGRPSAPFLFAYDPPGVTSVQPNTPDANGALVTMNGACLCVFCGVVVSPVHAVQARWGKLNWKRCGHPQSICHWVTSPRV